MKINAHSICIDDRNIILIGLPLMSVLISMLLFHEHYTSGDWGYIAVCIPLSLIYTGAFWFSLRWFYIRIRQKYPKFNQIGKRIGLLACAFLIVYFLVNFGLDAFLNWLIPSHIEEKNLLFEGIATLIVSSLIMSIYEGIYFYKELETTVVEKVNLERHYVESQLESLRNQVNPHFLFNSLNTLVYLIPEEPAKAVNFVRQLSKVYRYVLESRDAQVISLNTELSNLESYIFLLKERFGENLEVLMPNEKLSETMGIVPLTLQMLIENAIKHNIISKDRPLRIELLIKVDCIIVQNNLQRKNQVTDSTGVGLENIQSRYQLLSEKKVEVTESIDRFIVRLPIILLHPKEL
ncbi:MAG: histidine kinase [Saprospiraceae bacterium]|nr:histidine kinase [Saprospiraceae bacterium]